MYLRERLNEARAHQGKLPLVRAFTNNADSDRRRTGGTYPHREPEGGPRVRDPGLRHRLQEACENQVWLRGHTARAVPWLSDRPAAPTGSCEARERKPAGSDRRT